ncbi:MAG: glycoside hydrolase family 130 protein [Planctomycetota bacterium]
MLIERLQENPLIRPADVRPSRDDWEVAGAFNPGAAEYKGQTILLVRVAERPKDKAPDEQIAPIYNPDTGRVEYLRVKNNACDVEIPDSRSFRYKGQMKLTSISHLRIARSNDGRKFTVDERPAVFPETAWESFGLEDPRITRIDETYYIACKAVSENGICTSLITTNDFESFSRRGIIFCPENPDVTIFSEKIDGRFYALHRPVPKYIGLPSIWLASSSDSINWGEHRPVVLPRAGYFDSVKTGAGCVPIKTSDGWLEIYHGSDEKDKYSLGAVLLDSEDPGKVLARSEVPLMQPEAPYELRGFYGNVVFATGARVSKDGDITIYYGAADECTAAAMTTVDKILDHLS